MREEKPLISVVIPAYQAEDYLEECIVSVCEQEYSNIEILLVFKRSHDKTAELCYSLAKKDPRIIVIECQAGGVSVSRNIALDMAKGEYIAFVDSDDYVEKDYLQLLYEYVRKCDISICGFDRVKQNTSKKELLGRKVYYDRVTLLSDVLCNNMVGGYLWNKLFCGKIIRERKLRFFEDLSVGEDMCFIVSYVKEIDTCRYCDQVLYHYRVNPNSTLQMMYTNGIFDQRMLSNLHAAQRIAEILKDSGDEVQNAVSYRIVRTNMWVLFNLLKCRHYDKEILFQLQENICENYREYYSNENAKLMEKICCGLFLIRPVLFWRIASFLLQIVPNPIIRKYVNC